ncbi:MAG: Translation-associated GTPase [Parcubacteria group bacterium GW2011_GWC1_40_13]|nr:MAG: Translation-associated GTPase [Parcubacteria group bacterium GW2011_GWC1_40_13]
MDAIAEVVRIFEDSDIIHVDGRIDPLKDIEVINLELILADLQTVTKRIANLNKEVKKGDKEAIFEQETLLKLEKIFQDGKLASSLEVSEKEMAVIKLLNLLTIKPILYVLNKKAGGKNLDEMNDERYVRILDFLNSSGAKWVLVDAGIEQELKDLSPEEKKEFRDGLAGAEDDGIDNLIKKGYELLNLITYFTTGEDETRAWTIVSGWTAPQAGTAIHNDFKDKFIRAEVINWQDLLSSGSYAKAREKGLVRTEGKEYIVQDGDVIEFRI